MFFAVLARDAYGKLFALETASVKDAVSEPSVFVKGQTGVAKFVSVDNGKISRPRKKKSSNVSLVVGLIIALIVMAILIIAVWYVKKRRFNEKAPTQTDLGPVSFENKLYDDLHNGNKVQLPDSVNVPEQPRYEAPMPTATLHDYADVAAARDYTLPTYQEPDGYLVKKNPKNWVQFPAETEAKKVPVTDFVESSQYCNPYDFEGSTEPPSDNANDITTSLGDLRNIKRENSLPGVEGGFENESPMNTERIEPVYENTAESAQQIQVEINPDTTEC